MFANITNRLKEDKFSIGAALTITGVPLGMYLDFFFRIPLGWTVLFMALSLLLLIDWDRVIGRKFVISSPIFSMIFLLQIIMLSYGIVSDRMSFQLFSYHLYVLGLLLAYLSIGSFERLNRVVQWTFITSIPSVLFGVICCITGLAVGEGVYLYKQTFGDEAYNLDTLTISYGILNAFFSMLCMPESAKKSKILYITTIIFGSYVLLECSKRTPILILMIGLIVFCYNKGYRLTISPQNVKRFFVFLSVLMASYFFVDFVHERVDTFFLSLYEGLRGLLVSDTRPEDVPLSVYERILTRDWAINYILNDFKWYNYILGGGYFLEWIDYPILQAYLDLGILGTVLYVIIVAFFPLRVLFSKIEDNGVLFMSLLTLYPMFSIISSGTPYHPKNYACVLLLAMMCQKYFFSAKER